jgi:lysine 2,3-aminomutase
VKAAGTASGALRAERRGRGARSVADLVAAGVVDEALAAALAAVEERYAVAVTPEVLELLRSADPGDPIARQFVPDPRELDARPEESSDPIGDDAYSPVKGIVHRYPDRVLLKPIHVCPVYCRFCFRREKVGPGGEALTPGELAAALDYVRRQTQVWEVILTGGDPLLLSPRRLRELVAELDAVPHVRVVRLHTRVPVVDPDRVTAELVAALRAPTAVWVAVHTNHPRELTAAALAACARLVDGGVPLVSQTVLLRGVNDDPAVLEELLRTLVANRVKPYYLHHPDLARGTAHWRVDLATGRRLVRRLRGRLSGLAQPTYVLDLPGGHGKVPAGPAWVEETAPGEYRAEDPWGGRHRYPPPGAG